MADKPCVPVQRLPSAEGLTLPKYETGGASGLDLRAALEADDEVVLDPGGRALVPTGLMMAIPADFEAQVRPRSGLALKHGITVLNAPGTIDSDYRGEVKVMLINHGLARFVIRRGDKIAQLIISRVERASWTQVDCIGETERGDGGFGSTGV